MIQADVRAQLLDRRQRIESVVNESGRVPQLENLLRDIDRALDRFAAGTFGLCETCGEAIEDECLEADPLTRFCIDHLSPAEARALEQDLQLAARVQQNLLPPPDVAVDGWEASHLYQPLGTVSGDYVDLVRPSANPTEPFFFFGDIAGKGVAASMLMAHLHASVRTLIDIGLPLVQIVERANRLFCESTMPNHYATLVCGRLSDDGALEVCNAGHPPPLLIDDGRVTEIRPTGVPIGMFCGKEYESSVFRVASGGTLLLYTDGVSEAIGPDDCQYGADRLARVASSHASGSARALVAACANDLAAFRGRAPRSDDATLMAIRRV